MNALTKELSFIIVDAYRRHCELEWDRCANTVAGISSHALPFTLGRGAASDLKTRLLAEPSE